MKEPQEAIDALKQPMSQAELDDLYAKFKAGWYIDDEWLILRRVFATVVRPPQ